VLVLAVLVFASLVYWQRPSEESGAAGNALLVLVLFNLNIVVLSVLAFLIGRNVVKLIFDRRRNILGSKLRLKLVAAFVGLTLIPTSFVYVLASGLLAQAMEGWFSEQIESTVRGAVDLGRLHFTTLREEARVTGVRLARRVEEGFVSLRSRAETDRSLEARRTEDGLFSIQLLDPTKQLIGRAANAVSGIEAFREPDLSDAAVTQALEGRATTLVEERESSQFVRAYVPVVLPSGTGVLVVSSRVAAELLAARNMVSDSFTDYEQLKLMKEPLKTNYLLTLAMLTGLLLFSAIWIAFFFARSLVVPVQQLAEGTRAVARGNYDFQIRNVADDEIGVLVSSFNQMTRDLRATRAEVERRRAYLETVLANLAVGVVALDRAGQVNSINDPARALLGLLDQGGPLEGEFKSLLRPELYEILRPLLESDEEEVSSVDAREREVQFPAEGRDRKVLCTAGPITDSSGAPAGKILILDDITEISKMQALSAWREVARRVAHEIKNPLTPIQLSAQRLERLVTDSGAAETVRECAATIVEHVDSIKRLANEFSRFARMPTAEFLPANLNDVVNEVLSPYPDTHPLIVFQFIADDRVPDISIDREQIRRVFINLLDNAVQALRRTTEAAEGLPEGKIIVRTTYDRKRKIAIVEVADNGPGIRAADKARIWEPYFTTKREGSGLGLAIVNSVVAEHQGTVRVFDNSPRGSKFIIELPVAPQTVTQRRLAQG
jgi:two-component system nitrogen regulation sensor histidine kinase NtrY